MGRSSVNEHRYAQCEWISHHPIHFPSNHFAHLITIEYVLFGIGRSCFRKHLYIEFFSSTRTCQIRQQTRLLDNLILIYQSPLTSNSLSGHAQHNPTQPLHPVTRALPIFDPATRPGSPRIKCIDTQQFFHHAFCLVDSEFSKSCSSLLNALT